MYIALCSRDDCVDYHINIALSCVHTCSLHIHTICLTFLLYITTTLLGSPEFTCASMWKSMWNSCPCCCFTSFWRSCMYAYIYIYIYVRICLLSTIISGWIYCFLSRIRAYFPMFTYCLLPTITCGWIFWFLSHTCAYLPMFTYFLLPTVTCGWIYWFLSHISASLPLFTYCLLSHVDELIDFYFINNHICPCLSTACCHKYMPLYMDELIDF